MKGKVTNRFENHTIVKKKKKKNRPNNDSLQEKVCKEKQRAREPILTLLLKSTSLRSSMLIY